MRRGHRSHSRRYWVTLGGALVAGGLTFVLVQTYLSPSESSPVSVPAACQSDKPRDTRPLSEQERRKLIETASTLEKTYGIRLGYGGMETLAPPPYPAAPVEWGVVVANSVDVAAVMPVLGKELARYPTDFLKEVLVGVFLVDRLRSADALGLGQVFSGSIYLSVCGMAETPSFTNEWRATLHHELSSLILYRGYTKEFEAEWTGTTVSTAQTTKEKGFVDSYGMTSFENDFNTFAQVSLADPKRMNALAKESAPIRHKLHKLIRFYGDVDPRLRDLFVGIDPAFVGREAP